LLDNEHFLKILSHVVIQILLNLFDIDESSDEILKVCGVDEGISESTTGLDLEYSQKVTERNRRQLEIKLGKRRRVIKFIVYHL
jgi:hypothetical protein